MREIEDIKPVFEYVRARIAIHPIQAQIVRAMESGRLDFSTMSLRDIGALFEEPSAQKIKHHLEQLVKLGVVDKVGGRYAKPFIH